MARQALDNIDIAILNKVNELAGRYGIAPYEFVATVQSAETAEVVLAFEGRAPTDPERARRYFTMIESIGIQDPHRPFGPTLSGSAEEIWNALDRALQFAPKKGRQR